MLQRLHVDRRLRGTCAAQDWWNSPLIEDLCQSVRALCWNALVCLWALTKRAPRAKLRFTGAVALCFLFSAILHQLLVAVALRAWCVPYAALGMMAQVRVSRRTHACLRVRLGVPTCMHNGESQCVSRAWQHVYCAACACLLCCMCVSLHSCPSVVLR